MAAKLKDDSDISRLERDFDSLHMQEESSVLMQKLKNLQCPFNWKPESSEYDDHSRKRIISLTETKIAGAEDEGEECFPWTKFVLNLVLCYEYAECGAMESAFEKQAECVKILETTPQIPFMPSMGMGLNHVCLASKAFLFWKCKQFDYVEKLAEEIPDVDDMNIRDEASVWAVRGAVFLEYGEKGKRDSIPFIEKALQLDPQCGEMHFLLGKALSRVRRIEYRGSFPSERELECFKMAVKLSDNVFCKILLAQSYGDLAYAHKFKNTNDSKKVCASINKECSNIYRNVILDGTNNPYVLARCAVGLMRLPKPWNDMSLVEHSILKALEKTSSNCFVDHTAGEFYLKVNDTNKAKFHFERAIEAGSFYAVTFLLEVKEKENRSYNPVPDLKRYMKSESFSETQFQLHLLSLIGLYHYLRDNDFNKALEYWWQVISSDIHAKVLEKLRSPWFKRYPFTSNVNEIIKQEINERLRKGTPTKQANFYKEVLHKYSGSS